MLSPKRYGFVRAAERRRSAIRESFSGGGGVRGDVEGNMNSRAILRGLALAASMAAALGGAKAADLPVPPQPGPVVAPVAYAPQVYNWTGIYFGGHVGGGYAGSSWTDVIPGMANDKFNDWGFLGGAQAGANYQLNRFVFGVEGDFSWTSLKGSGTNSLGNAINTSTQWTSTVTGRIGAAFDRLLVYGKGGLALAEDQSSLTDFGGNTATSSQMRTGWTAGVGLEYALDDNWSAKIEYDYLGFGPQTLNLDTPLESVTSNASLNVQEIKAGLNFRFGGP
jgi:outer membrane immunogenic protein